MTVVKIYTALYDRTASLDKTKFSEDIVKQAFLQTSISDQRLKFKNTNRQHFNWSLTTYNCEYNSNFTNIQTSTLTSSEGKYSAARDWNFFSGKTKYKVDLEEEQKGKLRPKCV